MIIFLEKLYYITENIYSIVKYGIKGESLVTSKIKGYKNMIIFFESPYYLTENIYSRKYIFHIFQGIK